ncbi:hypothetical protein ACE1TF_15215 [Geomicrobium sp. JSM 1781026]|uniref:hypothetical protein n=1 Tax=Geomicrobium sp. JSM 1781026 TaxID=3344580 RepID=UPI0035C1CF82
MTFVKRCIITGSFALALLFVLNMGFSNNVNAMYDSENPSSVKLTQEELEELVILDDDQILPDDVLNISQNIQSGQRVVFSTVASKIEGSTINWNLTWTGVNDARIGAVGSDGTFYYLTDSGGSSTRTMNITQTQDYQFAIQNLDNVNVVFSGWRDM